MYCIVGGAFSGKRAFVRSCTQGQKLSWVSAYQGHDWRDWPNRWSEKTVLVMEGFEVWIKQALDQQQNPKHILDSFHALFSQLQEEEARRRLDDNQSAVYLIMLEMGRGIVPLSPEERSWRDLSGWVAQSGSAASEHVYILWHGLAQQLK
ncbi:hypothetical protein GCM10010965_26740 [Caldalkalibacillus thermarum]|uniref:bifunctional adenosylcobinamide kinase/adenosylcobinamide-phosphate guanylyltransferase n=1 Tax=Caldalkalibacillus thermarum TaxID=296745 RepID=UPI001668C5D0|nr:bifunctional adenosylcobinamide kinase/adenosylcobinamide-phosphate guanylyltransferase [Caldalkalibacillus thermarum]GGK32479.1 hypothetical protein GCM10010965_26740 [Caldalkalibacillus thermarum]